MQNLFTRYALAAAFSFFFSAKVTAQPTLSFDQTTRQMGTVLWQTPATATFTLTNKGTAPLRITNVRTDCGCTATEWTTTPIAPGGEGTVRATYNAELLGHFNKGLAVYTDQSSEPIYLTLVGTVALENFTPSASDFPVAMGEYFLSTDNVEFDDVNKGDVPVQTISLLNASRKSYRPELMHLPSYLSASYDPAVIQPGRSGRILLTLASSELSNMGLTQTSIYLSRFPGDRVSKETEINVSTTLLPDFIATASSAALAPRCTLDSTHIRLVLPEKKKKATGQIVLRNTGRTPLDISALQVYNPGIGVSLGKQRIQPGEEEKLKITVSRASSYFKGRRRILLITNDPDNPKVVVDVEIVTE